MKNNYTKLVLALVLVGVIAVAGCTGQQETNEKIKSAYHNYSADTEEVGIALEEWAELQEERATYVQEKSLEEFKAGVVLDKLQKEEKKLEEIEDLLEKRSDSIRTLASVLAKAEDPSAQRLLSSARTSNDKMVSGISNLQIAYYYLQEYVEDFMEDPYSVSQDTATRAKNYEDKAISDILESVAAHESCKDAAAQLAEVRGFEFDSDAQLLEESEKKLKELE